MQIGEGFDGAGAAAAHVNTVVGPRSGPVGTAWATALATPSAGHTPFLCVARPGVPVAPPTLFVSKATVVDPGHAQLTWGPAQAGVAGGIADALDVLYTPGLVVIAAVWVDPAARWIDRHDIYAHNRAATARAIRMGVEGGPSEDEFLAVAHAPSNPFYDPAG